MSKTILILTKKAEKNEYETARLLESFASKNITARACHPDDFDIIVSDDISKGIKYRGQDFELPRLVLCRIEIGRAHV